MSSYTIQIKNKFGYHASVVFGLDIHGPAKSFPLLVGCSLMTPEREVIDVPARWLKSPGLALWGIKADGRFKNPSEPVPMNASTPWYGKIIFALWRDDTFTERLADTGWVEWRAYWLIGSSTTGLDMQDEQIKREYGGMDDAWVVPK